MLIQFNFVQQCIQISTRINSSSVHTYIFVCFIRNHSNNPTRTARIDELAASNEPAKMITFESVYL